MDIIYHFDNNDPCLKFLHDFISIYFWIYIKFIDPLCKILLKDTIFFSMSIK